MHSSATWPRLSLLESSLSVLRQNMRFVSHTEEEEWKSLEILVFLVFFGWPEMDSLGVETTISLPGS